MEPPATRMLGRIGAMARSLRVPLLAFALSRLGILAVAYFGIRILPIASAPHVNVLDVFCWWDGAHFEKIARVGYLESYQSNFFPLFPLLGAAVHRLTGWPEQYSLLAVANLAALAGTCVIYRLFEELEGSAAATCAIGVYVAWPFGFFQSACYPESLMTLATASALYLAHRRRPVLAGVALGLGILARHLAVLGGGGLLVSHLRRTEGPPRRFLLSPGFGGLVLPLAIPLLYFGFLWHRFKDPWIWYRSRNLWGESAWSGVLALFTGEADMPKLWFYFWLSIPVVLAVLALLLRRAHWDLAGYGVPLMIALWAIGLAGLGRYTASCWPAALPAGVLLARRPKLYGPVVACLALVHGFTVYAFTHGYEFN